jgi:hypothetical protein
MTEDGEPDGRAVADALYGGGATEGPAPSSRKDRSYYGCDLDEDGHCRRAGTEHCDWTCPHPSTPADE